jgi:hypothetical protein
MHGPFFSCIENTAYHHENSLIIIPKYVPPWQMRVTWRTRSTEMSPSVRRGCMTGDRKRNGKTMFYSYRLPLVEEARHVELPNQDCVVAAK